MIDDTRATDASSLKTHRELLLGYAYLVAELIRLIQKTSQGSPAASLLIGLVLCGSLADKGLTAFREGVAFAKSSRTPDDWFEAVVEHTDEDSPIVLAFVNGMPNSYSLQVALRVYYILSQCYDRDNVYFCPIPPQPTIEEGRAGLVQADSRRHAEKIRSVGQTGAITTARSGPDSQLGPSD